MPNQIPNIWAPFVANFFANDFQKSPNLVTLYPWDDIGVVL